MIRVREYIGEKAFYAKAARIALPIIDVYKRQALSCADQNDFHSTFLLTCDWGPCFVS